MSFVADPQLLTSLEHDFQSTTPDAHFIAKSLVEQKKKVKKKVKGHWRTVTKTVKQPTETELAFAITSIAPDLTMQGGSSLVVTMQDPTWALMDSGFFDADKDGRLDNMDLNYPDGSRFWWRLHQFSPQSDHSIQLTFIPRIVSELMDLHGPIKVNRAKRTRAEFIKSLCAKVKDDAGKIEFYSRQLDIKQPIGAGTSNSNTDSKSSSKAKPKKAAKTVGLGAGSADLKVKGAPISALQRQTVNIILQVGDQLNAPHNALVAAIYAGMGESDLNPHVSGGVFQTTGVPSAYSGGTDVAAQAKGWFTGGTSFGTSAIAAANRGDPPWKIANEVEVNAVWLSSGGDSYAHQFPGGQEGGIREAEAIVAAGGGAAGGGTVEVNQPYYFEVQKGEDYWAAMNRLAQEVGWELIVDGNRIYYDSDLTLIRQKPALVISRDAPTVLKWNYDWVNRQIATNFQVDILCDAFVAHPGEVVMTQGFGTASQGSTAKLPGRWLIAEMSRSGGDQFSTFSLVQPTAPKKEPAPSTITKNVGSSGAPIGSITSETPGTARAAYAAAQFLNDKHLTYTQAKRTMTKDVPSNVPLYDCSASVSWVLLAAGFPLPGGISWGGWAPVSGNFMPGQAGLQSGEGNEMTIYANGEHVFIRIHPQGMPDMQGNTVNAGHGNGFCFFPWNTPGCGGWGGPSPGVGAPTFIPTHYPGT